MSPTKTLPEIDECVDLYLQIHDFYGVDTFGPDDLSRRLDNCGEGTDLPAETDSLTRLLDLLTAYGLLDRHHDSSYRVRCEPDEGLDRWRASAATRVEALYQRVRRTVDPSPEEPTDGPGPETIRHGGDLFVSVLVTDAADLDAARADVRTAIDDHPECGGVVLRSPGELAAEVQRFADELCEPVTTPSGDPGFEKITTNLVGTDKDDLEFRLFLRGTS